MIIGYILLVLFGLLFVGCVGGLIWLCSEKTSKRSESISESELVERSIKQNKYIRILMVAIIVAGILFIGTLISVTTERETAQVDETIPETEVIVETTETTECTTAPEIVPTDILPEPTETIHIEETEPATEEVVDIKPVETKPIETEPYEPPSEPVVEETESSVDLDELEMLACVIYQEAGGDATCDQCRYRVGDVVLNRVADSRFPNTLYGVLTARSQYGRFHWTGIVWPSRANNAGEKHAVERAYKVAEDILNGNHSELYGQGYIWQAEFVQGNDGFWCCGHFFGRS